MPERLFKYQPFTAITLENLKNRSLWFSAPIKFNDPFDCTQAVLKTDFTEDELSRAFEWMCAEHGDVFRRQFTEKGKFLSGKFRDAFLREADKAFTDRKRIQTQERGVACLTEVNTDLLMWGHYADGHRGFCLEFDASAKPFSSASKVVYSASLPALNPIEVLDKVDGPNDDMRYTMLLTKAECWRYEQEWRLIHQRAGVAYTYPWAALKGVYFGLAMPDAHKEIIALILHGSPTALYQMNRADNAFGVAPVQASYPPPKYE